MRHSAKEYKLKLEKAICEYMQQAPANERTGTAIAAMIECWEKVDDFSRKANGSDESMTFSAADAKKWAAEMQNADGTFGAHWNGEQTRAVAEQIGVCFEHISSEDWCATMNMMYSDYYPTALLFGINTPEFYASLAKNFLFDADGGEPKAKLAAYYHNIAAR